MPEEEVDAQRDQEAVQPDQVPDYVKLKAWRARAKAILHQEV